MNQLQPLLDLLAAKHGWVPTALAWYAAITTASRVLLKGFNARLQTKLTAAMVHLAGDTGPRDIEGCEYFDSILRSRGYRLFAFTLDLIFSVKLPTRADFARLIAEHQPKPSTQEPQ